MNSDHPASCLVSDLREAFSSAESEIYRTESVTKKSPVSALNELRYAGAHMLVYLQEENGEELKLAVMHGRRAYYDAQRFLLLFLMRDAQAIRDGIGEHIALYVDLVAKAYGKGKYGQLKTRLLEARTYIQHMAQIKTDGSRWEKRGEAFAACMPHIEALKDYINVYEAISDEFVRMRKSAEEAKLEEETRKANEAKDKERNFILGVLGLIATIVLGIAGICFAS